MVQVLWSRGLARASSSTRSSVPPVVAEEKVVFFSACKCHAKNLAKVAETKNPQIGFTHWRFNQPIVNPPFIAHQVLEVGN